MAGISRVLVPAGTMEDADVLGCLRSLYCDVAVDAERIMLDALLKIADPTHLLHGSDWPQAPALLAKAKLGALLGGPHGQMLGDLFWKKGTSLCGLESCGA